MIRPVLAARRMIGLALASVQAGITYLLHDQFITDDAAPLTSPRTCEPGPGVWTVDESAGSMSIASGRLTMVGSGSVNAPDLISQGTFTRQVGRGMLVDFVSIGANGWFGLGNLRFRPSLGAQDGNTSATSVLSGTPTVCVMVMRTAGGWFVARVGGVWQLGYPFRLDTSTPVSAILGQITGTTTLDNVRVVDLASPWNDDYGFVTQRLAGARSPGDTFTHTADCEIEFIVATRPSSGQIELRFRIQDASNYWQVTVDSSGNLDLDEVVAGAATQRGTAAGVVFNTGRLVIIAHGTTIRVYGGTAPGNAAADTLRITYSSASNFQTETDGELETEGTAGSVTDIVSWPRTLTGAAADALNAV